RVGCRCENEAWCESRRGVGKTDRAASSGVHANCVGRLTESGRGWLPSHRRRIRRHGPRKRQHWRQIACSKFGGDRKSGPFLEIQLVDPNTKGELAGLGACQGDSGGPVLDASDGRLAVIGMISWATAPALSTGCGGLTGVTPLIRYREWIVKTAAAMGSAL